MKKIKDFRIFSACHIANRKTIIMIGGKDKNDQWTDSASYFDFEELNMQKNQHSI
jgi:hypothetical protein